MLDLCVLLVVRTSVTATAPPVSGDRSVLSLVVF